MEATPYIRVPLVLVRDVALHGHAATRSHRTISSVLEMYLFRPFSSMAIP